MGRLTAILIVALGAMVYLNDGRLPRGSNMNGSGGGAFGDYANSSGNAMQGIVDAVN